MKKLVLFVLFFLMASGALLAVRAYHADGGALPPELERVLVRIGIVQPAPPPPLQDYATPEDELADVLTRLGAYQRELDERIAGLEARRREKELSRRILEQRGTPADDPVFDAMDEDLQRIERSLAVLADLETEARDVEQELRRVVDAAASVDEMYVDDGGSLYAARSVLTRIEQQGFAGR